MTEAHVTILVDILSQTIEYLKQHLKSDWAKPAVDEATAVLNEQIHSLVSGNGFNKSLLSMIFAPTSVISGISEENGWSDSFYKLSEAYSAAV